MRFRGICCACILEELEARLLLSDSGLGDGVGDICSNFHVVYNAAAGSAFSSSLIAADPIEVNMGSSGPVGLTPRGFVTRTASTR